MTIAALGASSPTAGLACPVCCPPWSSPDSQPAQIVTYAAPAATAVLEPAITCAVPAQARTPCVQRPFGHAAAKPP